MTNTKALEVAQQIERSCFDEGGYDAYKATVLIQAAIDEATQAERAMCDRLADDLELVNKGIKQGYIKDWLLVRNGETYLLGQYLSSALTAYTAHKESR